MKKSVAREYFESLVVAVILALFVRTFVFQAFKIPTGSMENNLLVGDHLLVNKMAFAPTMTGLERALLPQKPVGRGDVMVFKIPTGSMENNLLVGDHLLVNKMAFAPTMTGLERALLPQKPVGRGDVMVFKYPEQPDRDFIKRVIGLPGDRLELRRKVVYINGEPLDEPYVHYLTPPSADGMVRAGDLREEYGPVTVPEGQYFMMGDNRDNSEDSRYWGFLPASYVKGEALIIYFSVGEAAGGSSALGGIRWGRLANLVR